MTVRNITKTTVSVVILFIGFIFFRKYYVELVSKLMNYFFHIEEFIPVITARLFPKMYIGAFYPSLFYFSVIVILIARLLDTILDNKAALNILSPFVSIIIMTVVITAAICIEKINMLQLWGGLYFILLIYLHSTFKNLILLSELIGSYVNLKMIKGFFVTIKDTIQKAVSTGIPNFNNPVDETAILLVSAVLLLLEVMTLISFIVYLHAYWRLIFLAHLIK